MPPSAAHASVVAFLDAFAACGPERWRTEVLDLDAMLALPAVREERTALEAERSDPDVPLDAIAAALRTAIGAFHSPISTVLLDQFGLRPSTMPVPGRTERENRAARHLGRTGRWFRGPVKPEPYAGRWPRDYYIELLADRLAGTAAPTAPARPSRPDAPLATLPRHAPRTLAVVGGTPAGAREERYVAQLVDAFAGVLGRCAIELVHSPRGSGAEIVRRANEQLVEPALSSRLVFADPHGLVRDAGVVFVLGTGDEAERAAEAASAAGVPLAPVPGSGPVADRLCELMPADPGSIALCRTAAEVRAWLEDFVAD